MPGAYDGDPWNVFKDVAPATAADPYAQFADVKGPDQYQQAAIEDINRLKASGTPLPTGYTNRATQGFLSNWGDELTAGALAPIEAIRRGVNPIEGYRYAKARENLINAQTRQNTEGLLGSAAELTGGLAQGANLFGGTRAAAGAAIPFTAAKIPASVVNYGANIGKGVGYGAATGAGAGDTLEERGTNALIGGALGGTVAGALPPTITGLQYGARLAQLPRLRDPAKIATEQVAEAARSAGVTPAEIVKRVTDANAAGQPLMVADVLGKAGERKLAGLAKQPGEQRDLITDVLTSRATNMPNRVGSTVGEALGAPTTAEAASTALVDRAGTQAAPLYRQAERVPTWTPKIQEYLDDPIAQQGLRQGVEIQRLRTVGTDRPFNPRDAMITDFNAAGDPVITGVPNMQTLNTLKMGLDRMIEAEQNPVTMRLTARGNAINGFKQRLLAEIDAINPTYAAARQAYGGPMEVNAAVKLGQQMPTRGRYEDTLGTFNALPPYAQQGVRIGYADAVRDPLERTGNIPTILREKSLKGANELEALSLYQGPNLPGAPSQLRQRLNREEKMQRTERAALGGPATAENIADIGSTPGGGNQLFGMAQSAASGNKLGVLRGAYEYAKPFLKGESEAQRIAIARALLETRPDQVQALADRIAQHELRRRGVNPFVNRPPRYGVGQ